MFKGIIFDLDGVIVHTDELHYHAWKQVTARLGIPFNRTINNRLRGVARMDCVEILLEGRPPLSAEGKLALAQEKNALYRASLEKMGEADVDGEVRRVLRELRARGVRLAIGSSSKNAGFILRQVGLTDIFDAVSDGNSITRSKPDPEVFLNAAELLSLSPGDCAVVEDACAGIDAARAGGFTAIGLGDAAAYDKTDVKLRRFDELLAL